MLITVLSSIREVTITPKRWMRMSILTGVRFCRFWCRLSRNHQTVRYACQPQSLRGWLNVDIFSVCPASSATCTLPMTKSRYRRKKLGGRNARSAGIAYTSPKLVQFAGFPGKKELLRAKGAMSFSD